MKKRVVSLFLTVIMLFTVLTPAFAYAKSSTPVWDKYSKSGSHKVSSFTFKLKDNDFTYKVWYPKDIAKMSKRPVILYCNGTSSNYIKSPDTVKYLKKAASHGFVCLTNTDENTGMGTSMNAGMDALIRFNKKKNHKLYNKLNLNKVGLAGHSQGATCCLNLASKGNYANRKYFKAIYACSLPTPQLEASPIQNCPYDASLVSLPTLMISGTGATDNAFISPIETSLRPAFAKLSGEVIMARMKDVEHADSIMQTHPYMIAWFAYKLCGNKTAAKAFIGKSPELKTSSKMQDYRRKLYCKKTDFTTVKAGASSIKAAWKTVGNAAGYQLQYSTDKKFAAKASKAVFITNKKTSKKTIKNLKANKTYYVRIRAYRTLYGKKSYSKWSKVQVVTTKQSKLTAGLS
ncbi:MAG: fibronectin type III domain-containing protein [Eubacterium sp.]|nr:fibronectin type III domain-containing protein [Eubacterium sp.]